MKRYRQRFLHHVLLVCEQPDGTWAFQIMGSRRVHEQKGYRSALEAKQAAHLCAHRLLENKRDCGCAELLAWSRERP